MDFRSVSNLKEAYRFLKPARSSMQNGMSFLSNLESDFVEHKAEDFFRLLSEDLQSGYCPTRPNYYFAPKSDSFGLRPMAALALPDAIVYQALLNPRVLGARINSKLESCTFANRLDRHGKTFFTNYTKQHQRFISAQQRAFKAGFIHRLELDVQNYYLSISHQVLEKILEQHFGLKGRGEISFLISLLSKWSEQQVEGLATALDRGLPQGYEASDLLANAYLAPIDEFITSRYKNDVRFFRYNDDMVLMFKSPKLKIRILADITTELLKLGLALNGKSGFRTMESAEEFDRMRYSPYGEDPGCKVEELLEIENRAEAIMRSLIAGNQIDKTESSRLKYYLRVGGIFAKPFTDDAINLLFARPEYSFFASEYLLPCIQDDKVFIKLWGEFIKKHYLLTDW